MTYKKTIALGLLLGLASLSSRAIDIDFETYSTGTVVGQNGGSGTTWTQAFSAGTPVGILVVDDAGNNLLQTQATNNMGVTFAPSNTELGGTFDSASSLVAYSFDITYGAIGGSFDGSTTRIRFGGSNVFQLALNSNGRMDVNDGALTDANANSDLRIDFTGDNVGDNATANTVYQFSGVIDYSAKTYTMSVNGIAQTVGGDGDLGFFNSSASSADILFSNNQASSANFNAVEFDNLSITIVPEPTTNALICFVLAWVVLLHRRR